MTTARFWTWHREGFVRLTVRDDDQLAHSYGGPTDEGWHREWTRYWLEDGFVYREDFSDGCDCDGRMSHHSLCRCAVTNLTAYNPPDMGYPLPPTGLPDWQQVKSGQRDYSAEAMGY